MNEKQKQRRRSEDVVFNQMLICLLIAVIAEAVSLLAKRLFIDFGISDAAISVAWGLSIFFGVFSWVGLILTAAGVVWCVLQKKHGGKLVAPGICTAVVAYVWVLSVLAYFFRDAGVAVMVVLPIVAAVLILIYFLYQKAFFINAILSGIGMAALWGLRQYYIGHKTFIVLAFVVLWVVLIVVAVLAAMMKKNGGKLGKKKLANESTAYLPCWLTCAVVALAMLLGLVLGTAVAYYLIYAVIGWLFCLAAFYTVKLM